MGEALTERWECEYSWEKSYSWSSWEDDVECEPNNWESIIGGLGIDNEDDSSEESESDNHIITRSIKRVSKVGINELSKDEEP